MRKKVKVIKKLAAAGLAAILACQVMGCGTGEKPTKDVSDEKVSEVKSQDTSKKEVLKVAVSSSSISETEGTAPMEEMFRGFEEQNNCEVEIVVIAHDGWAPETGRICIKTHMKADVWQILLDYVRLLMITFLSIRKNGMSL